MYLDETVLHQLRDSEPENKFILCINATCTNIRKTRSKPVSHIKTFMSTLLNL